jgi:hypothetical protein
MALVRNFNASTGQPQQITLNWDMPENFNDVESEIIITRSISHYPTELYNTTFPTKATDSRPIELLRTRTLISNVPANITVSGNTISDSSANFPTSPNLAGRLLRDSNSKVFKIISNTSTSVTLSSEPANGRFVILPDFPTFIRLRDNFEFDIRTTSAPGSISNLVIFQNGALSIRNFIPGELANLIFLDGAGNRFLIKNNNTNTIFLQGTTIPSIGNGMAVLSSFFDSAPVPFIDNFLTQSEADSRQGSGLQNDKFYYYTAFTKPIGTNVAQAQFGFTDSGVSTQDSAISIKDTQFGQILYDYWPGLYRELDATGDLEDLMEVFGFQFNQIRSLIDTYKLQDSNSVFVNALLPLSEQFGLPSVGFSIGIDTLRRIAKEVITCWRLKGSKEGIALFIRMLTTWDVTGGTADFSNAIQDFLPNIEALRFFDPNLGTTNTRITQSEPFFVGGGRFVRGLPGIVIPGFFTFREFVINIPEVALYIGGSQAFTTGSNTTTMVDGSNNFGSNNSLVGNFLLPNQEEVNDIYRIISNTSTSITVEGIITNRNPAGNYAVLSPLNTNRFIILNKLLPVYIPYGTLAGFRFI